MATQPVCGFEEMHIMMCIAQRVEGADACDAAADYGDFLTSMPGLHGETVWRTLDLEADELGKSGLHVNAVAHKGGTMR